MFKSFRYLPLLLGLVPATGYAAPPPPMGPWPELLLPMLAPPSPAALQVSVSEPQALPEEMPKPHASVEDVVHPSPRDQAHAWIMNFITRTAPPGREAYNPEAQETKEAALARYSDIANDIIEVVYNASTKPLFGGERGRARTISVILGIMLHESGFWKNVDFGLGKSGRGDNGNSWCLMQMHVGAGRAWSDAGGWNIKEDRPWRYGDNPADVVKGSSGPETVADRKKCITEGLRLIKISFRSCHTLPFSQRLNIYASGTCKFGSKGSAVRLSTATKFWDESKSLRTFKDQEVLDDMLVNPGPEPEPDPTTGLVSLNQ